MRESGVVPRLVTRWYSDPDAVRDSCAKASVVEEEGGGFGLDRVGVFFLVVGVGAAASLVVLIGERASGCGGLKRRPS